MAASSIGDKVPRPGNAGKPDPNGSSVLTREDILEQARGVLLLTLDGSRHPRQMFEANWRRLWQLIGEADAAGRRDSTPTRIRVTTIWTSTKLATSSGRPERSDSGPGIVLRR